MPQQDHSNRTHPVKDVMDKWYLHWTLAINAIIIIRLINPAHHIGLFDVVFDLSSLLNRYPSYQRPHGNGIYQGYGGYNSGAYNPQGGYGNFYPGSGLGTNMLGNNAENLWKNVKKKHECDFKTNFEEWI